MTRPAKIALEDGFVLRGHHFGAACESAGEVVFNTSMTGYQEILTDPSYKGQIVTMTYPLIGNYGVNAQDVESSKPHVHGFVVKEFSRSFSNHRAEGDLEDYLKENNIPGISGVDTRALVRRIRIRGAMKGVISGGDVADEELVRRAKESPGLVGRDLVREVVPHDQQQWTEQIHELATLRPRNPAQTETGPHVVALDFGMKWNIPRHLASQGCQVTVVPGTASSCDILKLQPDGVFLSNGPGDPAPLDYAVDTIRALIKHTESVGAPIFGICLGHQLLSLALGGETYKLKFGHRGANQPVLNKQTEKVEITTQNHGFAVAPDSLPNQVECTHFNLNDQTLEGIRHRRLPIFSVQYHPEASAGPHDSGYLFDEFRKMLP